MIPSVANLPSHLSLVPGHFPLATWTLPGMPGYVLNDHIVRQPLL